MLSKNVCEKCSCRIKYYCEYYKNILGYDEIIDGINDVVFDGNIVIPDFNYAWNKLNIVICPYYRNFCDNYNKYNVQNLRWNLHRLPIVSKNTPDECKYKLEHLVDVDISLSTSINYSYGSIFEYPCPKCDSDVVLIMFYGKMIWKCISCEFMDNINIKTKKPKNINKFIKNK